MVTIKDALKRMLKDGEFEKIIKVAKGREKENAKEFYNAIKDFKEEDFDRVPKDIFINACRSWNIWKEIYAYMELIHDEEKQDTKKA